MTRQKSSVLRALACFSIAMFSCVGCGSGDDANRLFGSASDVYDLSFDRVQASRIADYLTVEYLKGSEKTVKLVTNLAGFTALAGKTVDLTESVGGLPRGTLQRVQATTTDFELQLGTLELDQEPTVGTELVGRFRTTLVSPAGRTLNGDFKAQVVAQ